MGDGSVTQCCAAGTVPFLYKIKILFYFPHITANSCTLDGIFASSCTAPAKNVTPTSSVRESAIAVTRLHRFICIPLSGFFSLLYPTICNYNEKTVNIL